MALTEQAVGIICGNYAKAEDKAKIIMQLARLNATTEDAVCAVLEANGFGLPPGTGKKATPPPSKPGRRTYPPELRKAVILELATGKRVADVAAKYDLKQTTVTQWKYEAKKSGALAELQSRLANEAQETETPAPPPPEDVAATPAAEKRKGMGINRDFEAAVQEMEAERRARQEAQLPPPLPEKAPAPMPKAEPRPAPAAESVVAQVRGARLVDSYLLGESVIMVFLQEHGAVQETSELLVLRMHGGALELLEPARPEERKDGE